MAIFRSAVPCWVCGLQFSRVSVILEVWGEFFALVQTNFWTCFYFVTSAVITTTDFAMLSLWRKLLKPLNSFVMVFKMRLSNNMLLSFLVFFLIALVCWRIDEVFNTLLATAGKQEISNLFILCFSQAFCWRYQSSILSSVLCKAFEICHCC